MREFSKNHYDLEERTVLFGEAVIDFCKNLPDIKTGAGIDPIYAAPNNNKNDI